MSVPIRMLPFKIDVAPLLGEVEASASAWNLIPFRTLQEGSPHVGVDDLWVRYNAWKNFHGDHAAFNGPHDSDWYPCAENMPALKAAVFDVMAKVRGERLGAVLITRIPPGRMVQPHIDGGWHAGYYRKFAVQLMGNVEQAFCFENDQLVTLPGDVYEFRNDVVHWVTNPSSEPRVTLIVCIRTDWEPL